MKSHGKLSWVAKTFPYLGLQRERHTHSVCVRVCVVMVMASFSNRVYVALDQQQLYLTLKQM